MICGQSDSLKIVWKDQPEHHMVHTYPVVAQNHHVLSPQRSEQPPPLNFAAIYVAHRGSSRPVTPGIPPGVPVTPPGVCFPNLVRRGDSPSMQEEAGNFNNMEMWSSPDHPTVQQRAAGRCRNRKMAVSSSLLMQDHHKNRNQNLDQRNGRRR